MGTWISQRFGQFAYFNGQLGEPDWTGKRVLDFGGNVGNLLAGEDCLIEPSNYWSVDVSRDAIAEGQRRHPDANFVFYDRYNCEYNPGGTRDLPLPDLETKFNYILAWSVVTHMSQKQAVSVVAALRSHLAPGGTLALSFIDPRWTPPPGWARPEELPERSNVYWRLQMGRLMFSPDVEMDVEATTERVMESELTWLTLLNGVELIFDPDDGRAAEERPHRSYVSLCTAEHMAKVLPEARIQPPRPPERLHCALIGDAVA